MNDNYLIPLLISVSVVITLFIFYLTIFMVINKSKQRRFQMEKKEMEYHYRNELLHTRLEVQEHALNQVSQEIHDNIGHSLSLAKMNLSAILNSGGPIDPKLLQQSYNLLNTSIEDLRNVSHVLNTQHVSHIGLEEAIRKELRYISAFNSFNTEIVCSGEKDLSDEQELMIFRITQEALTNITKYANATKVNISMDYGPENFHMEITDNGVGFNPDEMETDKSKGIGLANMQQRIKLMRGALNIESAKFAGTAIKLSIPYGN